MVIQDTSDLLAAVLNKLFGLFGVNQIVINKSDLLNLFLECDIFIPTDKIVHLALTTSNDKLVDLSDQWEGLFVAIDDGSPHLLAAKMIEIREAQRANDTVHVTL